MFNVLDQQDELDVDERYTFDDALSVIGGTTSALVHRAARDEAHRLARRVTAERFAAARLAA